MAFINFSRLKNIIRGEGEDSNGLFEEVLLLVLSRAARVDSNVESIEIEHVRKAMKEITGVDYSEGDVQTAASSELFESQPLERTLANASGKLTSENKAAVLYCLANLVRADDSIRHAELDFFDRVATALKASPSEIAGLKITSE